MSLRYFYDSANNRIDIPVLDVTTLEFDGVPFNPSGGGGGGGGENLQQTLTLGNNAGGLNITNLGTLTANTANVTTVNGTTLNGTNLNLDYEIQFSGASDGYSQIQFPNNASGNSYQVSAGAGTGGLVFGQFSSTSKLNQPLQLLENGQVYIGDQLASIPYVYVKGSGGMGRVYDSYYNQPPAATIPTISQVLTSGSVATGKNLTGLSTLSVSALTCATINGVAPSGSNAINVFRAVGKTYSVSNVGNTVEPFTIGQFSNAGLADSNYFQMFVDTFQFTLSNGVSDVYSLQIYICQTNDGVYNSDSGNTIYINNCTSGQLALQNNFQLNYCGSYGVSQLYLIGLFSVNAPTPGTLQVSNMTFTMNTGGIDANTL